MFDPAWLSPAQTEAIFSAETRHVPVPLRRIEPATLVWLNRAALRSAGQHHLAAGDWAELNRRWCAQCAWSVDPSEEHPPGTTPAVRTQGVADRYGGAGLARNGGSGRAAMAQGWLIKGVGRTPLVSVASDPIHATGRSTLSDLLRETIFGDITAAEFPWGAVPTIALLDTGLSRDFQLDDAGRSSGLALLVRPAVLRAGHFERSIGFLSANPKDGAVDAERVRATFDAVRRMWGREAFAAAVEELAPRWAEQLAYGFVHRLAHGGITSSNLALDGRLHDFGAMVALPSWASASIVFGTPPVGAEMHVVAMAMQTLAYHVVEDGLLGADGPQFLARTLELARRRQRTRLTLEVLRLAGLTRNQAKALLASGAAEDCVREVQRVISWWQRESMVLFTHTPKPHFPWDFPALWTPRPPAHLQGLRRLLVRALGIDEASSSDATRLAQLDRRCAFRSRSRPELYRQAFREAMARWVEANGKPSPDEVAALIDGYVLRNRRDSVHDPDDAVPVGFASAGGERFALFEPIAGGEVFALREVSAPGEVGGERLRLADLHAFGTPRVQFAEGLAG